MTFRPAAPAYIQFFPTLRCNLACSFCFNRELPPLPDVEVPEFTRMLDRLQAAGVDTLDLLGGEPTLHPQLGALVGAIAARRMRTSLSTNGCGDLGLLERLEDRFGRAALRVGVSLNRGEPRADLRAYIARRSPMLKSVCERTGELPQAAVEHLARPGAEYYLIFRDPVTRHDLDGSISYPEYVERLAALRARHPRAAGVACAGFVPAGEGAEALCDVRCPAGTTKLSVLPDGSVYPCYLLFSRPEYRLGNLLVDAFAAIWHQPRLEFFRTFAGNACPLTSCGHHGGCHGGCPAVSLLVAGDVRAPDPRCVPPTSGSGRSGRCPARRARAGCSCPPP